MHPAPGGGARRLRSARRQLQGVPGEQREAGGIERRQRQPAQPLGGPGRGARWQHRAHAELGRQPGARALAGQHLADQVAHPKAIALGGMEEFEEEGSVPAGALDLAAG